MNRKNTAIGIVLIILGVSIYLRNLNIEAGSLITLFTGLGLDIAYYIRREQPFIIFGGIFTAIGITSVLQDLRVFNLNITFETLLICLGIIFLIIYRTKHADGFIIPGMILNAIGIYLILMRTFNDRYASPSIFLLLGFAFYAIYFIAYIGKSNWPLVPATILLITGILAYGFSFKVITWDMIYMKRIYIGPLIMMGAGALILLNVFRKRN
ncbi:MAG: hypothetical protein ACM3ZR_14030 [Pseudomonadota bacterium]